MCASLFDRQPLSNFNELTNIELKAYEFRSELTSNLFK